VRLPVPISMAFLIKEKCNGFLGLTRSNNTCWFLY